MPREMSAEDVDAFFARLAAANPAPRSELAFRSPYTLLVAVMLSAQATDAGVNKVTPVLFRLADTPAKMLALGEEACGRRSRRSGCSTRRQEHHRRQPDSRRAPRRRVPRDRDALQALPGVGRKTANVVLNVAFGEPTIAVDTHVFRVANRTGLATGKTPRRGRGSARRPHAQPLARPRAPLADPARPLRLHRPQARPAAPARCAISAAMKTKP